MCIRDSYFRDTAHGFLVWALSAVVSAALLGSAIATLASGAAKAGASIASGAGAAVTASAAAGAGAAAGGIDVYKRQVGVRAGAGSGENRGRLVGEPWQPLVLGLFGDAIPGAGSAGYVPAFYGTVSYTHLDVYKRQA